MRTSPAVAGDAALVAGPFGEVLALDMATGCVRWSFEADAMIRGAIAVGEGPEGRSTAWFVDSRTNAYAVDLESGSLLWKLRVGWHAVAYGTGSPALHDGRLFVPVSSLEVAVSGDPRYECCTSSGAVAALDAATGEVLWYHRVIPGYPEETGENGIGTMNWGPSGSRRLVQSHHRSRAWAALRRNRREPDPPGYRDQRRDSGAGSRDGGAGLVVPGHDRGRLQHGVHAGVLPRELS